VNKMPNAVGRVKDTICYADGRKEVRDWEDNCIVSSIGLLVAALLKGEDGYLGATYWGIGEGLVAWDPVVPPAPAVTDIILVAEIGRKVIPSDNIVFLDINGDPTETITNKLRITLLFGEGECNGTWRELGIFGGDASLAQDSGIMINHKTHPVLVKTANIQVERVVELMFN